MKNFSQNKAQKGFNQRKLKGSGLLVMALVGAAVVGATSLSLAKANSIAINSMGSNKIALQAQQYAAAKGELIRATNYSALAPQGKANIGNTGFQDEVVVGAEADYDSTTKKKEVTIRVYKAGESSPRSSIIVTRYSKSLDSSIPSGTIIPWYGALGSIPSGFRLCDGSNGTPDLRNRFLVGAGSSYTLGATGGANTIALSVAQMPSHAHTRGSMNITGSFCTGSWMGRTQDVSGAFYLTGGGGIGANRGDQRAIAAFNAARTWTGETSWAGSGSAHENRPPYYAVYYLMKV